MNGQYATMEVMQENVTYISTLFLYHFYISNHCFSP